MWGAAFTPASLPACARAGAPSAPTGLPAASKALGVTRGSAISPPSPSELVRDSSGRGCAPASPPPPGPWLSPPPPRCRQLPAQPPITVSRVPGVTGAWGRRVASSGLPRATGSSAPRPPPPLPRPLPRPPSCLRSAGSCLIPVVAEQLSQVCGHRQVCPALRPRVCARGCATPPPRTCGPGCGITPGRGRWAPKPRREAREVPARSCSEEA